MRASYDRRLTNTLSHELLTPLNCIVNLSEHLKVQLENKLDAMKNKENIKCARKTKEDKKNMQYYVQIWSSGKILEYSI